jgi:enoyl-CoA hydratase/carnithine racemase
MAGQQNNENGLSHKDSFNALYALAKGHSMCFLPFIRKNFGSEALGWPGAIALIIMIAVGGLGRIPDILGFLGVWGLVMLCQRASSERAKRQGVIRHSRYEGDVDEKATKFLGGPAKVKQFVEPLFCLVVGVCVEAIGLSHGLAVFIGSGAFSLALVAMIDRQLDNKRVQAMRDAAIEQSYLAARFRGEIDE